MPDDHPLNKSRAPFTSERAPSTALPLQTAPKKNGSTLSSARTNDQSTDRLLTIPEFCRRYKRSRSRAYRLIQSGELLAVKDGRSTLIPVDAAEAWVAKLPEPRRTDDYEV